MRHLELADFFDQRAGERAALVAEDSLSSNPSGNAAQLTAMNGRCARGLRLWMNRAKALFPCRSPPE